MTEEQKLEDFFAEGLETEDEQQLSRRQFLRGGLAGGAVGLAAAAGTGVAVWKVVDAQALAALEAAQENAEAEIARLQGLVDLYQDLEKIGLDAILQTGMVALAVPLEAVELGAKAIKGGLDLVEELLLSLETALPTAQEGILWLEDQVSTLADSIERVETALGQAMEEVGGAPIVQALREFVGVILDNLPFGLGDKIRGVLDGLVDLVTSVDDLLEGVNAYLLEPLRVKWFSTEEGEGLEATLITPLVEHILDPLEAHLEDLATLVDVRQQKLIAPAEQALEQRTKVRENIAQYKKEHGLE
jgi:hypothetical protein